MYKQTPGDEMGVTGPAVPMWLPEGYELVELKQKKNNDVEILNFFIFKSLLCEHYPQLLKA